jgi:uncharacterized coiled-coil protein SlyX
VPPANDRLTRLEESHGFTEHTLEQLSAEMAGINQRLTEALRRLERLETRLEQLLQPEDPPGD